MVDRDPAFQWETEALRASADRQKTARREPVRREPVEPGWVTIRQAQGATGIPVGTLRRWARQGALPSRSQETDAGSRRLVWLDAVLERAATLGREAGAVREETGDDPGSREPRRDRTMPPPPPPRPQPDPPPAEIPGQQQLVSTDESRTEVVVVGDPAVDDQASGVENASQLQPQSQPAEPTSGPPDPPPGTMLVPVDAWNKMLLQLGNLHEAGRDLAEARERAAKAETEASFLRERLRELRERTEPVSVPAVIEKRRRRWFGNR